MTGKKFITVTVLLILGVSVSVAGRDLDSRIRAAGADIRVFCPAATAETIQWPALLYLNRTYGAEIYIAVLQTSPAYA